MIDLSTAKIGDRFFCRKGVFLTLYKVDENELGNYVFEADTGAVIRLHRNGKYWLNTYGGESDWDIVTSTPLRGEQNMSPSPGIAESTDQFAEALKVTNQLKDAALQTTWRMRDGRAAVLMERDATERPYMFRYLEGNTAYRAWANKDGKFHINGIPVPNMDIMGPWLKEPKSAPEPAPVPVVFQEQIGLPELPQAPAEDVPFERVKTILCMSHIDCMNKHLNELGAFSQLEKIILRDALIKRLLEENPLVPKETKDAK